MKTTNILAIGMAAALLTSCVKNTLYDSPLGPSSAGSLTVITDWSAKAPEASIPATYTLLVDSAEMEVSETTNVFTPSPAAGSHVLTVFNIAAGTHRKGNEVLIDTASNGEIYHMPADLFYAKKDFVKLQGEKQTVTAEMQQLTRRLVIELKVADDDLDQVASCSGTLASVCPSFDLAAGVRAANTAATTAHATKESDHLRLEYNLLDITPDADKTLTIHITYTDGETEDIDSDLSDILDDFGDSNKPLVVTTDLSFSSGAKTTASISGWQVVDAGSFIAK